MSENPGHVFYRFAIFIHEKSYYNKLLKLVINI